MGINVEHKKTDANVIRGQHRLELIEHNFGTGRDARTKFAALFDRKPATIWPWCNQEGRQGIPHRLRRRFETLVSRDKLEMPKGRGVDDYVRATPTSRLEKSERTRVRNEDLIALFYSAVRHEDLGRAAIEEFEGTESALLEHLMNTGGSGGARPKMNVTRLSNGQYSTLDDVQGTKLIVKLTSEKFDLKHSESIVEYCYMQIARNVGIEVPEFDLIDAGNGRYWLEQERFDCTEQGGRIHMISACGLLDAPFREPSLDYVDLVKATRIMCSVTESQKLIKRCMFNYLTVNQDDHSKNFSFLASDSDVWTLSPFYDIVYSPNPYKEHMTAFGGNGQTPKNVLNQLAAQSGLSSKKAIMTMAEEIFEATRSFRHEAKHLGLSSNLINEIDNDMIEKFKAL